MFEGLLTADPVPVRVRCCAATSGGVALRLATGEQVELAVVPDRRGARRACGLARRVISVTFDGSSTPWSAEVTAVWHRVPRTVGIGLAGAVALALQGTPARVVRWGPR
jgi:hypothetical protein